MIPTDEAAPLTNTQYRIGGSFRYTQQGQTATVPLAPVRITVHPDAALDIKYFHQRDVFSDDPFTPEVEPSVPFSLAVIVQNRGGGTARNLVLSSAQPQIVDNEKGLLINFKVIGAEIMGQSVSPSLSVNFGNIGPGQTAIGRWLFTSTLEGLFTDYKATFEHLDGLGDKRVSLIKNVTIHEMNHLVQAGGIWEDGKPDFLVNEVPDIRDLPDRLYQSTGSTNPVVTIEQANIGGVLSPGNLRVTLASPMPQNWVYLRVSDPGTNQYRLIRVERSDGVALSVGTNVWTTDRTFIGQGRRPREENLLHLLDYNSTGQYTLFYEPGTGIVFSDTNAPVSTVSNLPPASRPYFQVRWSGRDEGLLGQPVAGIAYYDVYVSANDGPFSNWLTRTELVSATYIGELGSRYAFYSVATDANGNRELAPGTPDASTTVSITNAPPSITISNLVRIDEGTTLDLPFTVADPDSNQALTVALRGAPPGLTEVAEASATNIRRLIWTTAEGHGPSTNVFTMTVRDNDFPSLSATSTVTIVVSEVNSPPSISPISNSVTNEGRLLSFTIRADDFDRPAQRLTYNLGAGSPSNASIGASDGVFRWRPTETQGGTTNQFTVVVQDSGIPSLSVTQAFTVVVRDTLGDFVLSLGTTNLFSGQSGAVPLRLRTGAELSGLSFTLELETNRLHSLALGNMADEVDSSTFVPIGTNLVQVELNARSGSPLLGDLALATLQFVAAPGGPSAVVPLRFNDAQGRQPAGNLLARPQTVSGTVFVIDQEPLLHAALDTNRLRRLVLYGRPERHYVIEVSTNLTSHDWLFWGEVDLVVSAWEFPVAAPNGPAVYFRAVQGEEPAFGLSASVDASRIVVEWPAALGDCPLLQSASLSPAATWTSVNATAQLVNGRYRVLLPVSGVGARFFRLDCGR